MIMKFFETSEEFVDMFEDMFSDAELDRYGLTLKVISTTKSKDVLKVSKASATTEFLTKKQGIITVIIYEEAFDRLPNDAKKMLAEMVLSNISYDTEKDKVNVETNPFMQVFAMRKKYGEQFLNALELSYTIIQEIEDEQKAKKEAEKEAKRSTKNQG